MEYDFVVTDESTIIHDISLQTTLTKTIDLFGFKVEVPYDMTKVVLTDVCGNNYTWNFPYNSLDFPNVAPNIIASAFFLDASGNTEEIKELLDASNLTFETTLTKTIDLFGIKVELPYDTSGIVLTDVCGNTYNWELPFDTTNFPNIGPNTVIASAFYIDASGNTEEIKEEFIAYNVGALVKSRNYYVQLKANINGDIYQDNSGNYGIYGATLDKSNTAYDISYSLPIGESRITIKTIVVKDLSENNLGTYDLVLDISTTAVGTINSQAHFVGDDYTVSLIDDIGKAQIITWNPNELASVTSITSISNDEISSTVTPEALDIYYSEKLTAIEGLYNNKSVIENWEMKILDAYPSSQSIINQVNAYVGGTKSLPNFFDDGEHITLALGKELELNINDTSGEAVNIIPSTTIFAVITQDSNAPRLNPP